MIHRTREGKLVEVVRASFKNDKLYNHYLYSLFNEPNHAGASVSLVPPISVLKLQQEGRSKTR